MTADIHQYNDRARLSGHINFQYSYLDYLISKFIWALLEIEKPAGVILTGGMDIRPKLDIAIELAEHFNKFEKIRALLKKLKNRGDNPNGFIQSRNIIVHGIYSSRDGDPTVMIESHRSKRLREKKPIKIEFLQKTLDEITKSAKDLCGLMQAEGLNVD